MNYIVDPRMFYFMNVVGNLQTFIIVVGAILLVIAAVILIALFIDDDFNRYPKRARFGTACLIISAVLCLGSVFIPSKETLIEMEIAKHVTYDSAETAVQMIQEATDYILENTGGKESK